MVQTLQLVNQQGMHRANAKAVLNYVASAELYKLSTALPLAIQICAKYDEKSLKQAGIDTLVSEKMSMTITKERNKLLETLTITRIQQGTYSVTKLHIYIAYVFFLLFYQVLIAKLKKNVMNTFIHRVICIGC